MKIKLRYVTEDMDRHGNVRLYFRRKGEAKVRLPGPIGSPEFLAAYRAALAGNVPAAAKHRPAVPDGSLRWLCVQYYGSAGFKALAPRTQTIRRRILDGICLKGGEHPYKAIAARQVRRWRDARADKREAANALVKALRQLFAFACEYELAEHNPARDVAYLRSGSEGFHSWTAEEVRQYEACHQVGTMARLAMALMLYTGQRRSDVIALGRQHVRDGYLVFTQAKNRARAPVRLEIPIVEELRRIIDASPCGDLTFIVSERGHPFRSPASFGNRFRKWCDEAGLPQCSAHGLRKAAASRLAELGCSTREIMAITGHRTSKEVDRYTRAADQKRLAQSAFDKLRAGHDENESVPLDKAIGEGGTKLPRNSLKGKG